MRKGNSEEGKRRAERGEKNYEYSGHYVIASSRPPERRPLERYTTKEPQYNLVVTSS